MDDANTTPISWGLPWIGCQFLLVADCACLACASCIGTSFPGDHKPPTHTMTPNVISIMGNIDGEC